jgi:chemotaxis response regulator CheB
MRRILLIATQPDLRAALTLIIQQQSGQRIQVEGGTSVDDALLAVRGVAPPDVVVLVVGVAISRALHSVASIRSLVPGCPVVIIDTLGLARTWYAAGWNNVDALLFSTQLATDLVPTILRLIAPPDTTPLPPREGTASPPPQA